MLPTSSRRCSTPRNVRRPSRTASVTTPRARQTAAAAIAFCRLCAPRRRSSLVASSGSSAHQSCPLRSAISASTPVPKHTRRAQPPRSSTPSPTGATATSSLPWLAKIRSFAARYASNVPWRSRWSGCKLSRTAPSGAKCPVSSSWKDETSHTTTVSGARASTSVLSAVPTLPATVTGMPASRWMWPMSSAVVVLPFVPVTATNSFGISRHANSTSPSTGMPRARASAMTGASAGTPGDLTTARACSSSASPSPPSLLSCPSARSPRAPSTCSTASPERARPTTRYGPPGSGGRGFTARASRHGLLVHGEPNRRAHARHDPEAQDDLRLRPPQDLEVVVDWGHQEDALPERLEREDLQQHRQRLEHEDPAEHDQKLLGLRHHREPGDRAAEAERADVAHEDRRRERVEPQEPDARADEAPREQRQVRLPRRDERDPDVREQHDRRASAREPVEPVGEVHRARRRRDDEVDQHRIEDAEVDRDVERAQAERVRQVGPLRGDVPEPDRDRDRHAELRARAQAERAALDDLRVVVGEPEQRARDRGAEHPDRAPVVVAEDQERDRDGGEDDDPAHRRRAGLLVVALGALLADELPELARAQERDELRRQEDADQQRRRARDEDLAH